MKRLLYLPLFLVLLLNCKKDNSGPTTSIEQLVGRWRMVSYENIVDGKKVITDVPKDQTSYLSFRYDGVVLDSNGLPTCCAPTSYTINGTLFTIVPKENVPVNPQCASVNCVSCPTWEITLDNDTMSTTCQGMSNGGKYVRE